MKLLRRRRAPRCLVCRKRVATIPKNLPEWCYVCWPWE